LSDWVPGTVIDVSKWQSSLPDLTGVLGVIARAGIGTQPDPMFATHIANARKAGKWVGAYWFNYGPLSVSDQVDAFMAREAAVGGVDLHVIDWEGADGFTADQTANFIRMYQNRADNPIGLYASESRFRDLGQDWNWIANYSNQPTKAWDMWQYGQFRGVDGNHAKQRILDLVKGEPSVDSFSASPSDMTIQVNTGAKVFATSDLTGTPIIVSPARSFDYVGTVTSGPRIIRWVPRAGDTATYPVKAGWAGFVARADAGSPVAEPVPVDTSPYTQAQMDAAKAAAAAAAANAQKATDQIALDNAQATIDAAVVQHNADLAALQQATADLATAAAEERERIALALGQDAANRVRTT
jgi:hypothetical protein